jgi:hypothetical protein
LNVRADILACNGLDSSHLEGIIFDLTKLIPNTRNALLKLDFFTDYVKRWTMARVASVLLGIKCLKSIAPLPLFYFLSLSLTPIFSSPLISFFFVPLLTVLRLFM